MSSRDLDERGQLGGAEVLPFGILVFVVGALLVANAWGVVDAKLAAAGAAREAARVYVEAPDEASALARATAAARAALEGHGRDPDRARISTPPPGSFVRCARIAVTVAYDVPVVVLPWIGGLGGAVISASARHAELVDPWRTGLPGPARGADCAG